MRNGITAAAIPFFRYLGKSIERRHFTQPPVYIGGCGRSGTTLLLSILSSHPDIHAFQRELSFFQESRIEADRVITPYMYRLHRELIRHHIKASANRYCEKSPVNIHYFNEIDRYHAGNFRMIHIIRDGRDVILSRHPRNKDTYWVEPNRWIQDVTSGLTYRDHPCMMTIHYERLVEHFEPTVKRLCSFLNIPVSKQILKWHSYTTVRKNHALHSPIEEIRSTSIGKWMQPEHADRVAELTGLPEGKALLSRLGYLE